MSFDLAELIERRQDELRGRPRTRLERLREHLPYRDVVIDWIGMGSIIVAGACFEFVLIADFHLRWYQ